jgi:hypothetical protein
MELRDFVSETLVQIAEGVSSAQERSKELGAYVNPQLTGSTTDAVQHGFLKSQFGAAQIVGFDVALTVTEGKGTKGGIGIIAGAITLGSSGQSTSENSSVSRVKFSVPLILPVTKS